MISSGHSKCDTSFAWRRSFSFFGCGGGSGWSSGGANSCVSGLAACSSLSGLNEGVLGVSRRAVGRKEASEANIAKDKAGPMSPSCLFGGLGAVSRITVTYVLQGLPSYWHQHHGEIRSCRKKRDFHGSSVFPPFFTRPDIIDRVSAVCFPVSYTTCGSCCGFTFSLSPTALHDPRPAAMYFSSPQGPEHVHSFQAQLLGGTLLDLIRT